jgi:hypothetical protein
VAAFQEYLSRYDHEHSNPWNRLLHGVGIPVIFVGLILILLTRWQLGLALLVGGGVLLFAGHRIEGNRPAFFQGPVYFLVGPLWVAHEIKELLRGRSRRAPDGSKFLP